MFRSIRSRRRYYSFGRGRNLRNRPWVTDLSLRSGPPGYPEFPTAFLLPGGAPWPAAFLLPLGAPPRLERSLTFGAFRSFDWSVPFNLASHLSLISKLGRYRLICQAGLRCLSDSVYRRCPDTSARLVRGSDRLLLAITSPHPLHCLSWFCRQKKSTTMGA